LNSLNQAIGSLAGAGSVVLGIATLTTGGNNTSTTFSGVISGSGGLTQAGNGTLTLSGSNTYTGPTTMNAGRIVIASGGSITSDVTTNGGLFVNNGTALGNQTVNTGGVVGGNGTYGNTTINGGTLSPGN